MSDKDKQEPKSWKDIIANGIEEVRASTVEIMHEVATGEQHHEERLEYTDLGEFFSREPEQQEESEIGRDMDYER